MKINKTELIVKASIVEEGLIEQVTQMILRNPRLFDNEKVVLMPDTHKVDNSLHTNKAPVGFTMTLSKGLIPVDYVSADMFCGVSSILIKDFQFNKNELYTLKNIVRDLVQVNRRLERFELTGLGTLGGGNHFLEIGSNGKDTLITVHSGSRDFGGAMFKEHKKIAELHTKLHYKKEREEALKNIEPKLRQSYLASLGKKSGLALLDVSLYPEYWDDLEEAEDYAHYNRKYVLNKIREFIWATRGLDAIKKIEFIESVHNFIDTWGNVPIVRKGSIAAKPGDKVVIPINMRDGVLVGTVGETGGVNYSLPHGAGRVMSRTSAFDTLNLQDFEDDMAGVISPTVVQATLDESPRAYKDIDTIISDIKPYLAEYEVFKSIFNYKGI